MTTFFSTVNTTLDATINTCSAADVLRQVQECADLVARLRTVTEQSTVPHPEKIAVYASYGLLFENCLNTLQAIEKQTLESSDEPPAARQRMAG